MVVEAVCVVAVIVIAVVVWFSVQALAEVARREADESDGFEESAAAE
ncbi:MAG: hypothetical protein JWP75_2461 [Frondihabitans sp.]|nr:hypothetical protein [Frondihabitans sp.]